MRVAVIGGGYGGLASAARLAKLGHEVALYEAGPALGGALRPILSEDGPWPSPVSGVLLPAVIKDLFRKSGRTLDRELDLEHRELIREHRFEDRTTLNVHGGSRGAQLEELGQEWVDYVESFSETWEVLRTTYAEVPWDRAHPDKRLRRLLTSRETLAKRAKRTFKDHRLRIIAEYGAAATGQNPRYTPAWTGLEVYLEQRFGMWDVVGGPEALAASLADRMQTRNVAVHLGTPVQDVVVRDNAAVAVALDGGEADADAVVVATDPRRFPALERLTTQTLPAIPPAITWIELDAPLDLPPEVVLHGGAMITLRHTGTHLTAIAHAAIGEDLVTALRRHRIDLRGRIVRQYDRTPPQTVEMWNGSPLGISWAGPRTVFDRPGPTTPFKNLYAAGAHATPGAGLPFVGLSAALVAQVIGPA
ncbi:phytoene desaturase [Nocardioides baekrokdamisoli]|uniref:Phytoene desaturase n=1 Tax=Nocardioides baekrokdamisoli TaxID=1804624 RepID=A0A3G9IQH8_9ACTN|nr:NAD(P)/FAD-dependent oxidoreductase [Nocardioides baekrokdamisoli]BBH18315.1 phytoene desaturase [Nocardioides baekrokdamisoli]